MARARDFFALRPPLATPEAIACAGLVLEGEPEAWIEAAGAFATPLERARAGRFRHALDAARHLAGRALARRMLGSGPERPLTAEFAASPWGKPLCPPAPDFSIAHAGAMVWVAVCHAGPVGVDVERTLPLPDVEGLAAQLHPQECAEILGRTGAERTAAFYRCWTRKEAVLKALGRGLSLPLPGFRVRVGPDGADWLASLPSEAGPQTGPEAWTARDLDAGAEHQCSVAAAARLPLALFLA